MLPDGNEEVKQRKPHVPSANNGSGCSVYEQAAWGYYTVESYEQSVDWISSESASAS